MFKKLLFVLALYSTQSFAAIECKIDDLNLMNDQLIDGYSMVRIERTDLETQWSYEISTYSNKSNERMGHQFVMKNETNEAKGVYEFPMNWQYFQLKVFSANPENTRWLLRMSDEQDSTDSREFEISCKKVD